ncbi:putative hydrolase or acyltransferase of alpha/beta superfamily [Belliella baltica DSM 15883]|uniref:Putative hydrolase or acyltransferase of alpha/beta superfamily n=1 Tax=Belliella baltica (strain DSM 15883 / CIP 108006 / LMG 21964 / BA134) TaxID=866536 RepID=I3Z3F0_BELBD|nr:alpha/beta hydrolase [Belliella baltica]AFL83768.1 putative hydrolase or acyltransferase of alpha/beta superfamily [Belliella baltica DSM 15883]
MISFTKQGAGKPIILLHGFCETKEMWKIFSEQLSKSHKVYCLDLPGFGESSLKVSQLNLEEVAVTLHDWMEEQEIQKPIIIGHSLGGYVALAMAELMGSEIDGIGLFHSTAFADDQEKKHTRNKTITFIKKHGVEKFIDSFVPPLFSAQHQERLVEEIATLIQYGKKTAKKTVIAYIQAMRDRKDRFEVWKTFGGAKLMIAGTLDPAIKIEASKEHEPFATAYHELEGVGHMGMFEAKKPSLIYVLAFLEKGSTQI